MLKFFLISLALTYPIVDGEISQFIVGGQDASPGQFPHMVSLRSALAPEVKIINLKILLNKFKKGKKVVTQHV
jgi:secreted trypsin-like serine protease